MKARTIPSTRMATPHNGNGNRWLGDEKKCAVTLQQNFQPINCKLKETCEF